MERTFNVQRSTRQRRRAADTSQEDAEGRERQLRLGKCSRDKSTQRSLRQPRDGANVQSRRAGTPMESGCIHAQGGRMAQFGRPRPAPPQRVCDTAGTLGACRKS